MTDFQIPITSIWALSETIANLGITLYPHQVDEVKWMIDQETQPPMIQGRVISGGLISDVMGLGKTKATVAVMTINPVNRSLIICPKSVFYQWVRELMSQGHIVYSIHPDYASRVIIGMDGRVMIDKTRVLHRNMPTTFIGLTTFGMVRPFPEPVHKLETASTVMDVISSQQPPELIPYKDIIWNRIVIDEAHSLRNGFSLKGDSSAGLRKKSLKYYRINRLLTSKDAPRWGLTGTPLQNRIGDVASILLWIGLPVTKLTKIETLKHFITLKMFRRTGANLHPITKAAIMYPTERYAETKITVQYSTDKEKNFYLAAAGELGERIAAVLEGGYENVESEDNMLVLLNMLRFLSAHPNMYITCHNKRYETTMPLWDGPLSKYDMIQEQLLAYYNQGESCIIFVHFYEEAAQIADRAEHVGYKNIEFMNGSVSMEDRDWIVQSSKQRIANGEPVLIVANVIACGEGINLQHFHNVIVATPDWNPAAEEQAIGRVDRIGQTRKVYVTRYYHEAIEKMAGTLNIDEYMKDKQDYKIKIAEEVINMTPNAAWTYPSMPIPGFPEATSTIFPAARTNPTVFPFVDEELPAPKPTTAKAEIQRRMRAAKAERQRGLTIEGTTEQDVIIPAPIPPVVPLMAIRPPMTKGLGVQPIGPTLPIPTIIPVRQTPKPIPHPMTPNVMVIPTGIKPLYPKTPPMMTIPQAINPNVNTLRPTVVPVPTHQLITAGRIYPKTPPMMTIPQPGIVTMRPMVIPVPTRQHIITTPQPIVPIMPDRQAMYQPVKITIPGAPNSPTRVPTYQPVKITIPGAPKSPTAIPVPIQIPLTARQVRADIMAQAIAKRT
jgi:superfamily II DNA or RNA helicase